MLRALAIILALAALASARAADRLSFTNHAPQVAPEVFARMTNAATYYSTNRLPWNSNNVIPVATCGNLPLGSLSRRVWARVLYPNGNGKTALDQYAFATGAVRFYRGGVKIAELPYISGGVSTVSESGTGICFTKARLFHEFGFAAAGAQNTQAYLDSASEKLLTVEVDIERAPFAFGLSGIDVTIDCDEARLEIDSLEDTNATGLNGDNGGPCNALVVFLAVLSQPPG